jgi:hypothetical protein
VLTRPSYVLGGRAMEIVDGPAQLDDYIVTAVQVSGDSPVLIDQYLRDAIEVDVDAICDGEDVCIAGVMQHIEEAGVHSGDSACSLPPYSLGDEIVAEIERQTRALALALGVKGLMNVQFAVKDGEVYLIEVNPRASRTVPFVAKAIGAPIAKIAARVMAGEPLMRFLPIRRDIRHIAVKEAVFPFARFPGVDPVLSPEMKSTGEVMGIDRISPRRSKSQLGAGSPAARRDPCSCRSRTPTRPLIAAAGAGDGRARLPRHRDRRHRRLSGGGGDRRSSGSTRWPRAGRTSSTGSRTATSTSSSTPPKAGRATRIQRLDPSDSAVMARCPTSPPRRRARPWSGRSRRFGSTNLKSARSRTIIPPPERDPHNPRD